MRQTAGTQLHHQPLRIPGIRLTRAGPGLERARAKMFNPQRVNNKNKTHDQAETAPFSMSTSRCTSTLSARAACACT